MLSKKLSLFVLPLVAAVSLQAQNPFNDPFFNDPFGDDIFKEMMQMQKQMDEMFKQMEQRMQQRSSRLVSPLGTYKLATQSQFVDKGDHYELLTNIPESKENHIDIRTQNGMISISAKVVHEKEEKANGMVSTSRSVQMFQQSTNLPSDADESNIKSSFKDGRLLITIGKKQAVKAVSSPVKPKEISLPKVDKKLKEKAKPAVEEKKEERTKKDEEKKTTSLSIHTPIS